MARLKIAIRSAPILTAPAGIWVEAVDLEGFDVPDGADRGGVYEPSFHQITFAWSVEGAPLAPFTAPGNMLPQWRDANRAFGKIAALFFPEPGRYRLRLVARDRSGGQAEATREIVIAPAGEAYPGEATICMSSDPGESWAGAPDGAQLVRDARALKRALNKSLAPTRLLFRRGQEFEGLAFRINKQRLSHLDAWGEGAPPVLRPAEGSDATMFALWNKARQDQFTVANIAFRGAWDAATETGGRSGSPVTWAQSKTPCHYTIWNCSFDGFDRLHIAPGKDLASDVLVGNSVVTNWRDYGCLFSSAGARLALVGCQMAQHEAALHGDRKAGGLSNNHGPLRVAQCAELYIGASDFFSRTGWSPLADEFADQPCLRLNTSGARGRRFNLERILCEGGFRIINFDGASTKVTEHPGNYLIDKAVLIGSAKTIGPFVDVDFGGTTLRNVLGILPDTPRRHPNRWPAALRSEMDAPGPGNAETPVAVYSSSFVSLVQDGAQIGADWPLERGMEIYDDLTLENNLLARAAAVGAEEMLPGVTPRFRGVRYNFSRQSGKLARAIAPGESFLVPYGEITEALAYERGGAPTSQAYWLAFADRDRAHMLWVQKVKGGLQADRGDFAVAFEGPGAVITNRGEAPWPGGAKWELRLDRTSRLAPMDGYYASPERLPLPPLGGEVKGGLVAEDDLFLTPRGPAPSQGVREPS